MSTNLTSYTVARSGNTIGVFTEIEIRIGLRNESLLADDYCWANGFESWMTIKEALLLARRARARSYLMKLLTHTASCLCGALVVYALSNSQVVNRTTQTEELKSEAARPLQVETKSQATVSSYKAKNKQVLIIDGSESIDYNRGYMDGMNKLNKDWMRESESIRTQQARAEAGESQGMMDFGISLLFGMRGTVQDVPKGLFYLHRLAAQGDKDACSMIGSYYSKLQAPPKGRTRELWAEELKYTALGGWWPDSDTIKTFRSYGNWDDEIANEGLKRAKEWAAANNQTVPVSPK